MNNARHDCVQARAKLLGNKLIEMAAMLDLKIRHTHTEIEERFNGNVWIKLAFEGQSVPGPDVETAVGTLRTACDVLGSTGPLCFGHVSWRRDAHGELSLREAGFGLHFAALVSAWASTASPVENGWTLHADDTLTHDATA